MIKVIGIGNKVMGDDGVALHVLANIRNKIKEFSKEIEVIIGETDFLYCLNKINNNDFVIIIDSTYLGLKSGEVTLLPFEESKKFFNKPNYQHNINLIYVLINNKSNIKGYIIGIEAYNVDFSTNLSDVLNDKFEKICSDVLDKIIIVSNNLKNGSKNA